jgi:oxidoreductase
MPYFADVTASQQHHGHRCHSLTASSPPCATNPQAEEAVKSQGFERVSIFRPGLLNRGDLVRSGMESLLLGKGFDIKVQDVAKLMVLDAERESPPPGVTTFEMKALMRAAKEGTAL